MGKAFPTKTDIAKKLVGTYVEETSAHHLSLISLINDQSKSTILTGLIDDYLSSQPTIDCLVNTAAIRAYQNFKANGYCGKYNSTAFKKYIEITIRDLKRHRISTSLIYQIVKELKNYGSSS